MNNFANYQKDFCGKSNVANYEEGEIHQFDQIRVQRIWDMLLKAGAVVNSDGSYGQLVDVGCGYGHLTRMLSERFECATGIDISLEQIMRAKEINTSEKLEFLVGKAENLPLESKSADVIVAFFSIHFLDINAFVSECLRVLKTDGIAIFWADRWESAHHHVDSKLSSLPNAIELIRDMNRELLEITRTQKPHPSFHIVDCHESIFRDINVTKNKELLSEKLEGVVSLAQMKKTEFAVPYYRRMGSGHPIHTLSEKLKALWKMEGASDEEIMMKMTMKAFPIMIRK